MTEKKQTKNQRYEAKLKAKGLEKITVWVPQDCKDEFLMMVELCRDNPDLVPHLTRSRKTGKWRSIEKR